MMFLRQNDLLKGNVSGRDLFVFIERGNHGHIPYRL